MNFELSENQALLKDGVERFMADRYAFESRQKRLAAMGGSDRGMWAEFAAMGWSALLVPEEQGGLGWGIEDVAIVLQEFGKGMVAEPYVDIAIVAVRLLTGAGTAPAASALADIASGETLVVPALLEAGGRYDYFTPRTILKRQGDNFVLSGSKILVGAGDVADHLIVSAMLDGALALLLVPTSTQGVSRNSYRLLDGSWATDVGIDQATVSEDWLLASSEAASAILDRALDDAALGIGAQAIGGMDRILDITNEYLHTRKQFGQPLAAFQALQHRMADLFIETEMARSALYSAFSASGGSDACRRTSVSAARVRIDNAGLKVGNMGIHLHGGMGMTMEYPVGHHYRRLVQLARSYGDTDYHLERYESLTTEAA